MDKLSLNLIVALVGVVLLAAPTSARSTPGRRHHEEEGEEPCPEQHFLSHATHSCVPCSGCPVDEIIRFPCTTHKDTVCGPFYEFEFFNNNGPDRRLRGNRLLPGSRAEEEGGDARGMNVASDNHEDREREDLLGDVQSLPGVSTVADEDTWRLLCYGLMGALLFLFLSAIAYILVLQLQRRRRRMHDMSGKTITVTDPCDPTVYYQAQILTTSPITSPSSSCSPASSVTTSPYSSHDSQRRSVSLSSSSLSRFSLLEGHLRRMLSGGQRSSGNVYVDPTGRVYTRKENGERVDEEEDTHPFVRVDTGLPLVHNLFSQAD